MRPLPGANYDHFHYRRAFVDVTGGRCAAGDLPSYARERRRGAFDDAHDELGRRAGVVPTICPQPPIPA